MELEKIEFIDIVAFDFFDTLVHRNCNPEKIITMWARSLKQNYFIDLSVFEIYSIRKECEKELRAIKGGDVTYIEIIKRVYDKISKKIKQNKVYISEFIEFSITIERKYELDNVYLDKDVEKLVKYFYSLGKKIIIVSDFYFGKDLLHSICESLKIDSYFSDIYVSCDYNARKSTGHLYKKILELLNVAPNRCLMIGDNKEADQRIPCKLGINIFPINETQYKDFILDKKRINKEIKSITKRNDVFSGYVGILYYFTCEVYNLALQGKCKKLLFCSREGELLKSLFDNYQKDIDSSFKIDTQYFYISRRASFLASLEKIDKENFSRMFSNYKRLTVVDFLDNLGFSRIEIDGILKDAGVAPDLMTGERGSIPDFDRFLNDSHFTELYNIKRNEARVLLSTYINQISSDDVIWIVDIGWRGTIQDNIYKVYNGRRNIVGIYFGLKDAISDESNKKIGIVFENSSSKMRKNLLSFNYLDMERVCSASHGPVEGYYKEEKEVFPIINNSAEELAIYNYIRDEQENLKKGFNDICKVFDNSPFDHVDLSFELESSYLYHLCIKRPERYKYYYNFRSIVVENFGAKDTKVQNKFTLKGYSEQFRWGMINYVFRFLDKIKLKALFPLAHYYCKLIYLIKRLKLKRTQNG